MAIAPNQRLPGAAEDVRAEYDGPEAVEGEVVEDNTALIRERIETITGRLLALAEEQVAAKVLIEERWLEDLRLYHGRYDSATEKALKDAKKSRMFVKLTRTKTNSWIARLGDLLFPNDERNWAIKPTPVPKLALAARAARGAIEEKVGQANAQLASDPAGAVAIADEANDIAAEKSRLDREMAQAKSRCELMANEMDDQLRECRYQARARDAIVDACKLGTGIMMGPLVSNRVRRVWSRGANGQWAMQDVADPRPEYRKVNPWNFFPDMSAATIYDAEFAFERFLLNRKQMRELGRQPGFDKQAIADAINQTSAEPVPNYLTSLRDITGTSQNLEPRWQVWCYEGSLEDEEVRDILLATGDTKALEEHAANPLADHRVLLWFCGTHLLKFGEHPLDSGDTLYSVFNLETDDTSIFGFGVPHLMSGSAAALNGAWRMMLDNAGLSVGPQVVIDQQAIVPAEGGWEITPRKVWLRKTAAVANAAPVFEVHNIPNNQNELVNVVKLAREFADDETSMTQIAQGEQGEHVSPTMGGMAMLMNSANVVFRRVVKNYDDDMTVPNITRLYDWNMQFNPDDSIKGDMNVDARGSSVLLVREVQATNLMALCREWAKDPVLGRNVKMVDLQRQTVRSLLINDADIILTDDEMKARDEAEAQNPPQKSPEEIKLEIAMLDSNTRLKVAQLERDTEMMKLAETRNMNIDALKAALVQTQIKADSSERQLAAEVGAEAQRRAEARAHGEKLTGSGGSIS